MNAIVRTTGKDRTRPCTAIYRIIMVEFERQRLARGLSMAQVDDLAGGQDGFYGKMIYPDTPNGRQSRWETVQDYADALFGRGFGVKIIDAEPGRVTAPTLEKGASSNALNVRHWRHRKYFSVLGSKGGKARAEKLTKSQRKAISSKGGRAWRMICAARRQGEAHREANTAKKTQT